MIYLCYQMRSVPRSGGKPTPEHVPHPPSPQMVIEILSAIAWPTSMHGSRSAGLTSRDFKGLAKE